MNLKFGLKRIWIHYIRKLKSEKKTKQTNKQKQIQKQKKTKKKQNKTKTKQKFESGGQKWLLSPCAIMTIYAN